MTTNSHIILFTNSIGHAIEAIVVVSNLKELYIHLLKVEVLSNLLRETLCGHTEPTIWNKF